MELSLDDWAIAGDDIPLLVNLMPAGAYLGEDYYHAGGVPAVIAELIRHDRIRSSAMTVNGKTIGENCGTAETISPDVIRTFETGLKPAAGIAVIRGNFFDSAVMKISVIDAAFRDRYLSNPDDPDAFEGTAAVFDGPEDYHRRIDDPANDIDENSILVMRGAGPIGYTSVRPPALPPTLWGEGIWRCLMNEKVNPFADPAFWEAWAESSVLDALPPRPFDVCVGIR